MGNFQLILLSVSLGAIGQIILKIAANKLGEITLTIKDIWTIATTPQIIIGLLFFGFSFLLWVKVLTRNDLSHSYPMVSIGYIIVLFLSFLIFGESLTLKKILGTLLIIIGVWTINL